MQVDDLSGEVVFLFTGANSAVTADSSDMFRRPGSEAEQALCVKEPSSFWGLLAFNRPIVGIFPQSVSRKSRKFDRLTKWYKCHSCNLPFCFR